VHKNFKLAAIAALAAAFAAPALADKAETKGGLKIKTDDGRFEMGIGGRIHLDTYIQEKDDGAAFGSGLQTDNGSGVFFRRARLSFTGKAYGWEYEFVPEFSQNSGGIQSTGGATGNPAASTPASNGVTFQELNISTKIGPGKLILGQFKPFRSMEELTSSNEITMMERPFTSASGLYNGGQFYIGAGYVMTGGNWYVATDVYNTRNDNSAVNSGVGFGARAVFVPVMSETSTIHLGLSGSKDDPENGVNLNTSVRYAGRRGANTGGLTATTGSEAAMFYGAELAGTFGPFYAQAEYGQGTFDQATAGADELEAKAYHVTLSYFITGETKPYNMSKAVFKSPKPNGAYGAWELTARYENIEDSDEATATNIEEVTNTTLGVNWYVNPNVRFMLNYAMGEAERVNGQKDEPNTVALRAQMNW